MIVGLLIVFDGRSVIRVSFLMLLFSMLVLRV